MAPLFQREETSNGICRNRLDLWARGPLLDERGRHDRADGTIAAGEDGLARLVLKVGTDAKACLEMPSPEDRALRERLRRRAHLVKVRTSARNRIFGPLTQFGLRLSHARLRRADAMELLERRGVPEVWRASIAELLEVIEEMDRRIIPLERELGPLARHDRRAKLLATMPGIGPVGLTFAAEIGEVLGFDRRAS